MDEFDTGAGKSPLCRQEEGSNAHVIHFGGAKMSCLNPPKRAAAIRLHQNLIWAHDNFLGAKRNAESRRRLWRVALARREEVLDH